MDKIVIFSWGYTICAIKTLIALSIIFHESRAKIWKHYQSNSNPDGKKIEAALFRCVRDRITATHHDENGHRAAVFGSLFRYLQYLDAIWQQSEDRKEKNSIPNGQRPWTTKKLKKSWSGFPRKKWLRCDR